MQRLSFWIDTLTKWTGKTAALLVLALVGLVVYDAFSRYLFNSGSVALQELEWHLFDLIFLLGIAYTLKHDKHVRVDLFYHRYPPRVKAWVNLTGTLLLVVPLSAFIAYWGIDFTQMAYDMDESSPNPGGLPYRFLIKGAISFAFFLVLLQSLSEVVKQLHNLKKK